MSIRCLSKQTELVRLGGVLSICDHSLSGWNWTREPQAGTCQNSASSQPTPRGCHLVTAKQECSSVLGLGYSSALVLPLKQTPELSRVKGSGKVVWLCSKGLELGRKRHDMPHDLQAVGQQAGRGCAFGAPGSLRAHWHPIIICSLRRVSPLLHWDPSYVT